MKKVLSILGISLILAVESQAAKDPGDPVTACMNLGLTPTVLQGMVDQTANSVQSSWQQQIIYKALPIKVSSVNLNIQFLDQLLAQYKIDLINAETIPDEKVVCHYGVKIGDGGVELFTVSLPLMAPGGK